MIVLKTVTTINGRTVTGKQAVVSVFDNSLLYAEGLFETLLGVDDHPLFEKEHLRRLERGSKVIGLPIPVSKETLSRWMRSTLRLHPARIKKLRLTITSGESARWTGRQGKPQVILSVSPHEIPTQPFRLLVSDFRVDQHSIFRNIKTISYVISAAAIRQAKARDFDDALLLNERGDVAEVTSANIFWAVEGKLFTPPLSAGCLEGVTRGRVMTEARRLGVPIKERPIRLDELLAADEIFISSSLKLVVGVSQIIDGRRVHRFPPGPLTSLMVGRFNRLVKA